MTPPRHSAPADVAEPPALVGRSAVTLADLFRQQVADRPTAAAVTDDRHTLSFADLAARAGRLADRLRRGGVGAGDLVGLYLTPGTDIVTATWGVLLAGAAYLPLATDYPEQRVAYMIEDAHVRTVVTEPACSETLGELVPHDVRVLTLDDGAGTPAPASVGPDDLAYVIYTSGTTGRPKGVAVEHRAIANQLAWLRDELGLAPGQTIIHKTPTSFDAAQWETLAVAVGAHVVVAPPGAHRDPAALIDTITAHDVTVLQCVPTLLQALVDEDRLRRCRSLRLVCSGGEALSRRLAARFAEVLPECALVNLYGPTECTINSSSHLVTPATLAADVHTIPIGRPVAGTTFHVLDNEQRPVAPGAVGELHIGGVQLARGYLGRDEETTSRFPTLPLGADGAPVRVYRSGDLVSRDAAGTTHFVGRTDNQVKLRGHRIELDEVRLAIENHGWVRNAAVLAQRDRRTGAHQLVACVELNPREAALMDQGNHGAHHQSKQSRVQVRAQLANLGLRTAPTDAQSVVLPGKQEDATARRRAFARKTYRFYDGGPTRREDILAVLGRRPRAAAPTRLAALDRVRLGAILRYFGQFHSDERILPKYAYASPGALYATQLHIELSGVAGIPAGAYYYHPVRHELVLVRALAESAVPWLRAHFLGKRSAIESVYRNNVVEVLKMETGHMLGLLDEVLPEYGLALGRGARRAGVPDLLDADQDHTYLGSYDIVPADEAVRPDPVECYVQVHSPDVAGLAPGMYAYRDGELVRMSDSVILRKHVIAINQGVYERSAFGVSLVSRARAGSWFAYVDLGRALQRLESNDVGVGFMSSGYSSETGDDLPAATRLTAILHNAGHEPGPCYFAVGGTVSAEQIASEGMKEDSVHTAGPAEMIRRDIADILPAHMIPARVVVLDELPRSANGKVDVRALAESGVVASRQGERVMVNPSTPAEREVCAAWSKVMKTDDVSVRDDFFESGGNSLSAVVLIQEINRRTGARLPVQLIFDEPTVAGLARRVDSGSARPESRLVPLQPKGSGRPIICWPGLGGYPMNLRPLAEASGHERPFLGVQATGINLGETPYDTVAEMARHDVALIRRAQPTGPYTLWGYSFGARVAFETAYQLERQGAEVDQLVLIAPGSPVLRDTPTGTTDPYRDRAFVTLLYSVFAGRTTGPELAACLAEVDDRERFVDFVARTRPALDVATIRRIMTVVERTYSFEYTFEEMAHRNLRAPITVLKARGDDYSFVEKAMSTLTRPPAVREFDVDHYAVLRPPAVHELAAVIRRLTEPGIPQPRTEDTNMPHVNIKHFPAQISQQQQGDLVAAISNAVQEALGCDRDAISIAMEPISPDDWYRAVYQPEIEGRPHLLCKTPRY